MSDQDSIIQRKFLPVSLLLTGFPPPAQQFASRKPTCAGPTQILLFYYFTILLFYYFTILLFYYFTILLFYYFTILLILREIGSLHLENPTLHVGPGFYYPEKIPPCLFTFNRISSTGSAVCISKTHLCWSDPDFTILLFYYFTNLTGYREFASRKPNLACRTRILLSRENSSLSLYF